MKFLMDLFPKILDMSVTASVVILIVILARLLLKKAPKAISYALWGVVLLRLLCPFSFESAISIVPAVPEIEQTQIDSALPSVDFETYSDREVNRITLEQVTDSEDLYVRVQHSAEPSLYLSILWSTGVVSMLAYSIVSYIKLRKQLKISVPLRENIFIADDVKSPFVVGFIRPRIYLPGGLEEKEQEYIILHEQHHIRRCDHIIKLIAFAALCLHWFNPLVWLAFVLSNKDMEMSCDEAVIRKLGEEIRADYSASLLTFATGRRIIAGTPLAFGEGDTKDRIRNLANWRKPVFWMIAAAVAVCAILAVCLITNPISKGTELPKLYSHVYSVSEVVYELPHSNYSMIPQENTPIYTITDNMQLFSKREHSEDWTALGTLTEFDLTKENFDDLLRLNQRWTVDASASSFRRDNVGSWMLVYNQDVLYYVLQQKNGDVYLAYGYYDYSEKDDPYSDDTSIRWLYKLTFDIRDGGVTDVIGKHNEPPAGIDYSAIPNKNYPLKGDYLTLHEALYCIEYARANIRSESLDIPEEARAESVYCFPYHDYIVTECTFFGNGEPCDEWNQDTWHSYPFHSDGEAFMNCDPRPAWGIVVSYPESEAQSTEIIYVDAQTGDMYNDTKRGGYHPSPYTERSAYAQSMMVQQFDTTTETFQTTTTTTVQTSPTPNEPSDDSIVQIRDYLPGVYVDLKYASANNFTGQIIYDFTEPSLRYGTVKKLYYAQQELIKLGYSLKIWDAYRPFSAQEKLWNICPDPKYVSDPSSGNLSHCRGNAIDVTLVLLDGTEIEMPTGFDNFTALADRDYSDASSAAANNALLLQNIMEQNGFKGYYGEWWHYADTESYAVIK